MKKFHMDIPVVTAEGTQTLTMKGSSKEEAFENYKKGDFEITSSDVEVLQLETPTIMDLYED